MKKSINESTLNKIISESIADALNGNLDLGLNNENRNYSYEIIYSQEQCRKYEKYTSPGAWCVTYGKRFYDYYVKKLKSHFVVFKQDGFENVPRKEERNMWKGNKPQDTYGNSLIILLQSNKNGEPIYITSRWNHGHETNVEADHAYTKEEFMQITGISDADLQHIFEEWKENATKKTTVGQMGTNGEENLFEGLKRANKKNLKEHIKNLVRESIYDMGGQFEAEDKEKENDDDEDGRKSDMHTETNKETERRTQVEDFFAKPGVDHAPYAYALKGVDAQAGKDTNAMKNARSVFEKELNHTKNEAGYPYSFSSDEVNRLQSMISNNQLSEAIDNAIRKVLKK